MSRKRSVQINSAADPSAFDGPEAPAWSAPASQKRAAPTAILWQDRGRHGRVRVDEVRGNYRMERWVRDKLRCIAEDELRVSQATFVQRAVVAAIEAWEDENGGPVEYRGPRDGRGSTSPSFAPVAEGHEG